MLLKIKFKDELWFFKFKLIWGIVWTVVVPEGFVTKTESKVGVADIPSNFSVTIYMPDWENVLNEIIKEKRIK